MLFANLQHLVSKVSDEQFSDLKLCSIKRTPKLLQIGSKCGHDRENPRFQMIDDYALKQEQAAEQQALEQDLYGHKWRPAILHRMGERVKDFYQHPEKHPSFCFHLTREIIKSRGANLRQIKSQFREGLVRYLAVCLRFMDLNTMLIGTYDRFFKFHNFTIDYLAQQAGISISQAERAHQFLKEKGVLISDGNGDDKVCIDNGDGTFSGRASPKRISARIFEYFGLGDELKAQRNKASERLSVKKEEASKVVSTQEAAAAKMRQEKLMRDISKAATGKVIDPAGLPKKGDWKALLAGL